MNIVVHKYGGTSVQTEESREIVIRKIIADTLKGNQVIAVVSAMGRRGDPYATDTLLDWIEADMTTDRERDLISICGEIISAVKLVSQLKQKGYAAEVLTGPQAGIMTDGTYFHAAITSVEPTRLLEVLQEGKIAVVAGHQGGVKNTFEICTLGRGGSDITAVALGAALQLQQVVIYTDVDGLLSADPAVVPHAAPIRSISYDDAWEMAVNGARVINPQAVLMAKEHGIVIHICNTFSNDEGTIIGWD